LNDVILFVCPLKGSIPSNQIVELTLTATGHLQPHDWSSSFGLIGSLLLGSTGHKAAIV
jgi:hypothetical protein